MTTTHHGQRKNRHKLRDIPTPRNELRSCHNDHGGNHQQTHGDGVFESFGDLRDLDEEVGEHDFLGGCAP
jgi:hypothetical protein